MVSDPIVVMISIIVGIFGLLIVAYFAGTKIGEKRNGYVTQTRCDKNIAEYSKDRTDLYEKLNETNLYLERVATQLEERT